MIVDVVEKEDRQELLIRLLLYSYITVIEERIRLQFDREDVGNENDDERENNPDRSVPKNRERASSLFHQIAEDLFFYDHEAVLRWHDVINKMTHPCSGLEIYDGYQSFRKNFRKWKCVCEKIMLDKSMVKMYNYQLICNLFVVLFFAGANKTT